MSEDAAGSSTFRAGAEAYDRFMGRYSTKLAEPFADFAGVAAGIRVLDVGCGPGAFTDVAVRRAGAAAVCAIDPTPGFVETCRRRHPGVDVRRAPAERIPFDAEMFDCAAAQLVFHFLSDPGAAAAEMTRVVGSGGVLAACVWDFADGMQMLRAFWDAALSLDPAAPDEARVLAFGGEGELTELFTAAGLEQVSEQTLAVDSSYVGFDELWEGFDAGVGPAGAYLTGLPEDRRLALRGALFDVLGRPPGEFTLGAVARCARAVRP